MPAINDVVELTDGSVGVISAALPRDQWRVEFPESRLDILAGEISQTLSAPSYSTGEEITVWPNLGTISAIDGDTFTVNVTKRGYVPGLGYVDLSGDESVQRWRVIRDNDTRLERIW